MKKQLTYTKFLMETIILTGAVAIIAAAVYFSWCQVILLSAVFPVLELYCPISYPSHYLQSP